MRRDSVTVNGVRSKVIGAGPRGAEAAVFVHGNPGSGEDFAAMVEQVGAFGRAVAIDMPGFGEADRPRDFAYTVEGYAAHLGGALEQLGVERAHLVLHDFGGPWGLQWAASHPGQFKSVVLIDTGVLLDYRWHAMARRWRTPILGELTMALMALAPAKGFRQAMNRGLPRPLPDAFLDRMRAQMDGGTRRAVLKLYRATSDVGGDARRLMAALRPLDRPALVIWGERDAYLPVAQARRQLETFPRARIATLPESGHWPFADDPGAVVPAVVAFLREQLTFAEESPPSPERRLASP